MAVMGRLVGLPTRVAVGYLPGRYNSLTGLHEVRLQDAHAWIEIRFERCSWVPFDPTPAPNSLWAMGFGSASLALGFQQILHSAFIGFAIEAPAKALGSMARLQDPGLLLGAVSLIFASLTGVLALLLWRRSRRQSNGKRESTNPYTLLVGPGRTEVRKAYKQALR